MATRLKRKKRRLKLVSNNNVNVGNQILLISDPIFIATLALSDDSKYLRFKSLQLTTKGASYKIDFVSISRFVEDLCKKFYLINKGGINLTPKELVIDLHKTYFTAEAIRDFYTGEIRRLLDDDSVATSSKVVSFGFLSGDGKPQRRKFIELCSNMDLYEFISTPKFNRYESDNSDQFVKVIDLKRSYKYFIDLKGHSYSTKSLLFMASKRVFFSSKHNEQLHWEKTFLKPWENFIPVANDLSDLEANYKIIEEDQELYNHIVSNNILLLKEKLSQELMLDKLTDNLLSNLKTSSIMIPKNKNHIVFLHIPKCGGISLKKMLRGSFDDSSLFKCFNHRPYNEIPDVKNSFIFTFVRNPWDRILSLYSFWNSQDQSHPFYKVDKKQVDFIHENELTFHDFVKHIRDKHPVFFKKRHPNPYIGYFFTDPRSIDFIGKVESYQEDFDRLCDIIGISRKILPVANKSNHARYNDYYNDETQKIVSEIYAEDIDFFEYRFDR